MSYCSIRGVFSQGTSTDCDSAVGRLQRIDINEDYAEFCQEFVRHNQLDGLTATHQGELWRRTLRNDTWDRREFMLVSDKQLLVYYSTKHRHKVKSVARLSKYTVHNVHESFSKRPYAFLLACSNDGGQLEETLVLSAESQEEKGASFYLFCRRVLFFPAILCLYFCLILALAVFH